MFYQITWKILPGLRGLSCSEFRAAATLSPDAQNGVVFEAVPEECGALLQELEAHFSPLRFSNAASAFESVKSCVLERAGRPKAGS